MMVARVYNILGEDGRVERRRRRNGRGTRLHMSEKGRSTQQTDSPPGFSNQACHPPSPALTTPPGSYQLPSQIPQAFHLDAEYSLNLLNRRLPIRSSGAPLNVVHDDEQVVVALLMPERRTQIHVNDLEISTTAYQRHTPASSARRDRNLFGLAARLAHRIFSF